MRWAEWKPMTSLASFASTATSFKQFCKQKDRDWRCPSSTIVQGFVQSFRNNGPSVPLARFNCLKWLQTTLGWKLSTENKATLKIAHPPADHVAHQAAPTPPGIIPFIMMAANASNDFVRFIGAAWMLLLVATLRPRHIQRSSITVKDDRIEGRVKKGKTRGGSPFWWAAPRFAFQGLDLGAIIQGLLEQVDPFNLRG